MVIFHGYVSHNQMVAVVGRVSKGPWPSCNAPGWSSWCQHAMSLDTERHHCGNGVIKATPGGLRSPCFMLGLDTETWMSFQCGWFSGGFLVVYWCWIAVVFVPIIRLLVSSQSGASNWVTTAIWRGQYLRDSETQRSSECFRFGQVFGFRLESQCGMP